MSQNKFITIVDFTAYDRPMQTTFVDDEPVMKYVMKRRIALICGTALIKRIRTYEGALVHHEEFKHEPVSNPQLHKMLEKLKQDELNQNKNK